MREIQALPVGSLLHQRPELTQRIAQRGRQVGATIRQIAEFARSGR
ncbi:hypothetical protein ABIB57_001959 [Devosia sp. UYZn731]